MKKVKFKITGITCEHTVKNALNKEGILEKNVSFKTGEADVLLCRRQNLKREHL
ncbi:MAG: hypothetical protein KJ666_09465 [Bacteroidetes bacterium]|nr:hypothetical protein [Bacteroidota bacterium]MBU2584264.1 hypothetical protein [Bacteroidota bacterium]